MRKGDQVERYGVGASTLSDVLAAGLTVVFCGINPALAAFADGYNFSTPSNRFWRVLHGAGFTPRLLHHEEERELLCYGCGITAVVTRATRSAAEVCRDEFTAAAPALEAKMKALGPKNLVFLGKAAFGAMGGISQLHWGDQRRTFAGARVWVMPNPSGRNRSFSLGRLTEMYAEMRMSF